MSFAIVEVAKGNNALAGYYYVVSICCKNTVSAFFFSIGNYSEAVNDAKNAIELQPSFLKAFIRGKSTVVI